MKLLFTIITIMVMVGCGSKDSHLYQANIPSFDRVALLDKIYFEENGKYTLDNSGQDKIIELMKNNVDEDLNQIVLSRLNGLAFSSQEDQGSKNTKTLFQHLSHKIKSESKQLSNTPSESFLLESLGYLRKSGFSGNLIDDYFFETYSSEYRSEKCARFHHLAVNAASWNPQGGATQNCDDLVIWAFGSLRSERRDGVLRKVNQNTIYDLTDHKKLNVTGSFLADLLKNNIALLQNESFKPIFRLTYPLTSSKGYGNNEAQIMSLKREQYNRNDLADRIRLVYPGITDEGLLEKKSDLSFFGALSYYILTASEITDAINYLKKLKNSIVGDNHYTESEALLTLYRIFHLDDGGKIPGMILESGVETFTEIYGNVSASQILHREDLDVATDNPLQEYITLLCKEENQKTWNDNREGAAVIIKTLFHRPDSSYEGKSCSDEFNNKIYSLFTK